MRHRPFALGAAFLAAAAALAGCSSGGTPQTAASAAPAAASQAPGQPETAAGARATAQQYFDLYSAGQYAAAWALLSPAAQKAIPQSVWVAVHEGCPSASAGLAYDVKHITMAGNTAVATVTLAGALSKLATGSEAFTYSGGRWGFSPSGMSIYGHGSVAKDIAAAKAKGLCSG